MSATINYASVHCENGIMLTSICIKSKCGCLRYLRLSKEYLGSPQPSSPNPEEGFVGKGVLVLLSEKSLRLEK